MLTLTTCIFYLKLVLDKGKVQTFKPTGVFPEGLWQERRVCDGVYLPSSRTIQKIKRQWDVAILHRA